MNNPAFHPDCVLHPAVMAIGVIKFDTLVEELRTNKAAIQAALVMLKVGNEKQEPADKIMQTAIGSFLWDIRSKLKPSILGN